MSATVTLPNMPTRDEVLAALGLTVPEVPANGFELALVMGGTVAAGAYTAGAVDFLVEALDCFQAEKQHSGTPYHNLVLKVIAGTSGGGVIGAILARALAYKFPSQYYNAPALAAGASYNPLFDTWVTRLNLAAMLTTTDVVGQIAPSVLNHLVIDAATAALVAYTGDALAQPRDWVGAPLRVILTHVNLSGVPVNIDFGGGQYQRFIDHADYANFAVSFPGQAPYLNPKPFEYLLNFPAAKPAVGAAWPILGQFACATAAFPIGFIARPLERPLAHYYYRAISLAAGPVSADDYWVLQADWQAMLTNNAGVTLGDVHYSAIDGGAANNEPIQLAHRALAGLTGRNPRTPEAANRAVWLIDPFAGEADMNAPAITGLLNTGAATLDTLLQQGRYSTADMILAVDPKIYSRYMLSASRDGLSGGKALATAPLAAFFGFACEAFRAHDYYLGRQNCKAFLQTVFRQSSTNPVFNLWTPAQVAHWQDAQGELPLIPLFGSAAEAEASMAWPQGALNPQDYEQAIKNRYNALLGTAVPAGFWHGVITAIGGFLTDQKVADFVLGLMQQALKDWGLG